MSELSASTIHELHEKLAARELGAGELCATVFERIGAVEDKVKAYLTLTEEKARAQASAADERIGAGRALGVLDGIPLGIKDVISTRGVRTTCGSKILGDFVPVYDAHVMELLEAAGIVMTGKLNMDEFAMGSSCENSGFHPTRNPWDLDRVPGGSSGGSAAAVAAGECVAALGSDTGGSIRQPAALCGVVGMKPTYGLVSRYGLVAFASSLDQIGPLTRDVRDCALIMNAICGHDARDSTSIDTDIPDYAACLTGDVKGLKVGVPREFMAEGLEPGVRARVDESLRLLEGLGASIEECSLPHAEYALAAYYLIAPAEASSNLARYDGVRYGYRASEPADMLDMYGRTRDFGFGDEVKRRIMIGTYALSSGYYEAYYGQAQKVRTLIVRDFEAAFAKYDVLVSPTSPTVAFKLGEKTGDPLAMYLSDICTIPVNLAGLPAISVPCGLADGLPVGLQIIGPALGEEAVLRSAHALEQALSFDERPKL